MAFLPALGGRMRALFNENPKGPWGGGSGGGSGGGGDNGGGPRNPWSIPPSGPRGPRKPTALDELLRQVKRGGGHLPGGAQARSLWLVGVGLVLLLWVALTSFHPIGPQQRGVVTYFGRYGGTLDPGVRMTLPAPFADVAKVDVQAIRTEDFPENASENLMLTRDRNILDLAFSVRWNIANPEDFVFQIADPTTTVRATAESAMREVVANVSLDEAIGAGRTVIETQVQDRMQRILDSYKSGIRVQGVAVKQAKPPEAVNDAFKDVTAAQQDAVAAKNNASGFAQQLIAKAEGEAAEFDKVYGQYKLAPEVTKRRLYYETMEDVLAKSNKTIIEAPGVTPYLPLPELRRREPTPAAPAPGAAQ